MARVPFCASVFVRHEAGGKRGQVKRAETAGVTRGIEQGEAVHSLQGRARVRYSKRAAIRDRAGSIDAARIWRAAAVQGKVVGACEHHVLANHERRCVAVAQARLQGAASQIRQRTANPAIAEERAAVCHNSAARHRAGQIQRAVGDQRVISPG